MNIPKKLIASTVLAVVTTFSAGAILAAELDKAQITKQVQDANPGSKVEKVVKEHKGSAKVWAVTLKGKDGKESTHYYDAATGKEVQPAK
jgi:uncharacterized membrane protein YkoI